ncbi:unnamed protein product [Nippostrongylus brasiliensis]|uniref:Peptidase A1 domain-containing protein n=1 Tax=Nippostrongylus brasiliensis TaxID=27835 RepID=A0A0N4Y3X3_NIPBR|nr:unnamed protein product [Nippostrongylus brasiliensis]
MRYRNRARITNVAEYTRNSTDDTVRNFASGYGITTPYGIAVNVDGDHYKSLLTGNGVFNVNVGVFKLSQGNLNRLLFNDESTLAGLIIVANGCTNEFAPPVFVAETGGDWET